jgi:4-amino-4-deoxy-L-arabinose transferase-like glycosyltransferase
LVAFLTHAAFISFTLLPGVRALPLLAGDGARYVRVAKNIVQHGKVTTDSAPPFRWEADRPPGYPLLIAASISLAGHERWTLYFAALSAAAAAWAAVTLAGLWTDRKTALHAAGLFVAFMPNSLGLSAMLLVDAIFGHLMLLWCCLVHMSFRRTSESAVIGSVVVFALLQLLRPQLLVLAGQ